MAVKTKKSSLKKAAAFAALRFLHKRTSRNKKSPLKRNLVLAALTLAGRELGKGKDQKGRTGKKTGKKAVNKNLNKTVSNIANGRGRTIKNKQTSKVKHPVLTALAVAKIASRFLK